MLTIVDSEHHYQYNIIYLYNLCVCVIRMLSSVEAHNLNIFESGLALNVVAIMSQRHQQCHMWMRLAPLLYGVLLLSSTFLLQTPSTPASWWIWSMLICCSTGFAISYVSQNAVCQRWPAKHPPTPVSLTQVTSGAPSCGPCWLRGVDFPKVSRKWADWDDRTKATHYSNLAIFIRAFGVEQTHDHCESWSMAVYGPR